MGAAAVPFVAATLFSGYNAYEVNRARRQAERQAAEERERLAAIEAKDPPAIPDPVETTRRTRRRSIRDMAQRRGRASTILSDTGGQALGA